MIIVTITNIGGEPLNKLYFSQWMDVNKFRVGDYYVGIVIEKEVPNVTSTPSHDRRCHLLADDCGDRSTHTGQGTDGEG